MKKFLFALFAFLLFVGCERPDNGPEHNLVLDSNQKAHFVIPYAGGNAEVVFTSSLAWKAEVINQIGEQGWITIDKTAGDGGVVIERIHISVTPNDSETPREAIVRLVSGPVAVDISVSQEPKAISEPVPEPEQPEPEVKVFEITENSAVVESEGGEIRIEVHFNVEYEVTVDVDWIREVETKAYDTKIHHFIVEPNELPQPRNAMISFCGNDKCIPFIIEQEGRTPDQPGTDPDQPGTDPDQPGTDPDQPGTDERVFELTERYVMVPAEGGDIMIEVLYNVDYEVITDVDWIHEVETRAHNTRVHHFVIDPNEQTSIRSANILFVTDGDPLQFIVDQQGQESQGTDPDQPEGPVFELVETSVRLSTEGGEFSVKIKSSNPVTYSRPLPSWIEDRGGYAGDLYEYVFFAKPNYNEERSVNLKFISNGDTLAFNVQQEGLSLEVLDKYVEVGVEGGEFSVRVNSNVNYTIEMPDWITEVEGTESGIHNFVAASNSGEVRSANIYFCFGELKKSVLVSQDGIKYELDVDKPSITAKAAGTSAPITVNVTSNTAWTVSSDSQWCSVSVESGNGDGSFDVTILPNETKSTRIAIITVAIASKVKTVTVLQEPKADESGDDLWKTKEFYHRSLVMRFTADWCGYCPQMAEAVSQAEKAMPDKIESISVHGVGSSFACEASLALVKDYRVGSYPLGVVDGTTVFENSSSTKDNIIAAVRATESKYKTYTGTSWTSSVSGGNITLDLSAYIKKSGSYKITALLLEDGVIAQQYDNRVGDILDYNHSRMIRGAFSSASGDSFEVSEDNTIKYFTYTVTMPTGSNAAKMSVLVYIMRKDSDTSSYYVDNSLSCPVGVDQPLPIVSGSWSGGNEGIDPGDDIIL